MSPAGSLEARRPDGQVVAAAATLTALNAAKPLVVDDYAYVAMARHLGTRPLDPLGFTLFWEEAPLAADRHLLTPVVPYLLAPAVALFPEEPALWKLWLFPLALALAAALDALAARFAPSLRRPLLWLVVLSPAVLPAFNLMLDVPALAFSLSALAVFLSACDRGSLWRAAAAGLLAGLGAQAKFTALSAVPALLLGSLLRGFPAGGILAVAVAAAAFGAWEWFLLATYGHSMLLSTAASRTSLLWSDPWPGAAGLVSLVGGLAPGTLALALVARGASSRVLGVVMAAQALLPVALSMAPAAWFEGVRASGFVLPLLPPEILAFLPLGAATVTAVGLAWRGSRRVEAAAPGRRDWPADSFLQGWLLIEVAALAAMTPFLAARRMLGLVTVMTLMAGRAAHNAKAPARRVAAATVLSASCGGLVWLLDLSAARETRATVEDLEGRLRSLGAGTPETVWYAGHWSFQYYAQEKGWRPVIPGQSVLKAGDWLVQPARISRQPVDLPRRAVAREAVVDRPPPFPLTTIPFYYVTPVPYGRLLGAQVPATIERVTREVKARDPNRR